MARIIYGPHVGTYEGTHQNETGETPMVDEVPLTITVPEAGRRYFDMSRGASYAAATRGDIPTIRVGRLLRVPVPAMERKLDAAGQACSDHD
jgi:hypothetical protein